MMFVYCAFLCNKSFVFNQRVDKDPLCNVDSSSKVDEPVDCSDAFRLVVNKVLIDE